MTDADHIHQLMRQARIAISREDFEEAERNYALVLQDPEMMQHFDIKMRYAFCIEKTGNISKAIELYQEIIEIYTQKGETGAAKALELKVNILLKIAQPHKTPKATKETEVTPNEQGAVFQDTAGDDLDFVEFLSLGTQEIDAKDAEELTQTLMMDNPREAIEEQTSKCIDVELQEIDEDLTQTPTVAPAQHRPSKTSAPTITKTSTKGSKKPIKKHIPQDHHLTEAELSHRVHLNTDGAIVQENEQSVEDLAALIRQGIQANLGQTKDITKIDLELTSIGEYEPDVDVKKKAEPAPTTPVDKAIEEKASQLFGKKR